MLEQNLLLRRIVMSGKAEPVTCVAILHSYSERMNAYIQKEQCR
jgi:hypothetical protein